MLFFLPYRPTALIATTTLKFSTLKLTPFDGPIIVLRNCPVGVIAWGIGFTDQNGAIGDTPINAIVHIRLFAVSPKFGIRNPNKLIGRWRFRPRGRRRRVGSPLSRGFRATHCIDGGVFRFGGAWVPRSIRMSRIHRGSVGRKAMGVVQRCLVSFIETFESFSLRNLLIGQGIGYPQASNEAYASPPPWCGLLCGVLC